jgi:hypothetical protein
VLFLAGEVICLAIALYRRRAEYFYVAAICAVNVGIQAAAGQESWLGIRAVPVALLVGAGLLMGRTNTASAWQRGRA